jgi:hypothetical protein
MAGARERVRASCGRAIVRIMSAATLGSTTDAGLDLKGACTGCKRVVLIETATLEAMAARYGREAVLFDVMQRITCKDCGGRVSLSVRAPRRTPIPP